MKNQCNDRHIILNKKYHIGVFFDIGDNIRYNPAESGPYMRQINNTKAAKIQSY